jgi:hypothetical protein
MLEITGADIAALNDDDLRSLVGRLCESELHSRGLPTSAVTWGGNQNARDGGIDVRVKIEDGEAPGGFIPRISVGFQVKKTDFTPSLITPEMRPSGQLRASIKDLIEEHGAYIIVSSGSDTSDTALAGRVETMQSVVTDTSGHADLLLDFYDRNRLATWTRLHPGLAIWVRERIGRGFSGWQPYTSWANSPDGVQDQYLIDDKARLHTGVTDEKGIDVTHGIDRIREILRIPRGVVRLAGLSGVGKTRFVQALFDARVGSKSLDPALVVYSDMSDNPSPQPTGMISDLIATRTRAIVVIDNCAPDLHRRITEICRKLDSPISAITVEYDVQDDEPEGTDVFRLEPSSVDILSTLIARRFPQMTRLDVDKIAEFSGGNARIALALAGRLERHESVAGLQDEELFRRLFHQRQEHDDDLLKAAQVCALLYSFQGEALTGNDAELPKLAVLAGIDTPQLFAKVAQLRQRDLVQCRSVWRAILPHAIANRLARMALREIPLELIEQQFDTGRTLKSFSRRLGYLHDSDETKRVVEKWLTKDGLLAAVGTLSEIGFAMLNNVAPVSPEITLAAIEAELAGSNAHLLLNQQRRGRIATILRSIAYDATLFDRCVIAMIQLGAEEPADHQTHPIEGILEGLFHLILSGTHATIEQRVAVVDQLLRSTQLKQRSLGLKLLAALLKSEHFSATHSFDFGARARDYGYWPKTREEETHWFVKTLQLTRKFVTQDDPVASGVKSKIAHTIGRIWFLGPKVQDEAEIVASEIARTAYWQEGWIAVRSVLARPLDKADAASVQRLRNFEVRLRPKNTTEQIRTVVLTQAWGPLDYANIENDGGEITGENLMAAQTKAAAVAEELGKTLSEDQATFITLLPELVTSQNPGRLTSFGKGLALAAVDQQRTWEQLTHALSKVDATKRNFGILVGFLIGLSSVNDPLCEALLDKAVADEVLSPWFPVLQTSVTISATGAERLKNAIVVGKAPVEQFRCLGWGRSSDAISGDGLKTILLLLAKKEGGYSIATDILSMRFHSDREKKEYAPELLDAGRKLLSEALFKTRDNVHDHHLHNIASLCLRGPEGSSATLSLCTRIKQGLRDYTFRAYDHGKLLECIFRLQPRIALDSFFGSIPNEDESDLDVDDSFENTNHRKNPLDSAPFDEVLRWCDEKPAYRYLAISSAVSYMTEKKEGGPEWTPLAVQILTRAPNAVAVLEKFVARFSPTSWSGSRAAIIESRVGLLDKIFELKNPNLTEYVARVRSQVLDEIHRTRKWENERDRSRRAF